MQIGTVSFRPYIYNANIVSANSLSRISSIGNDLTMGKTDFSALSDESLNENPLKKGQTLNFNDVLNRQMWEGRQSAARIMKPEESVENLEDAAEVLDGSEMAKEAGSIAESAAGTEEAGARAAAAGVKNSAKELNVAEAREDFKPAAGIDEMFRMQPERNLFQIQRAIEAYQMNMTA